jgi:hypothetical protein
MLFNRKFESGQALAEYVVTIPIGVAIIIVSGLIVSFLTSSFQQTADGLEPTAYQCNQDDSSDDQHEGPRTAQLSCHTIELISEVYDPNTDTTTVGYRVTSACDPSISHWTLVIPSSVASKIQSASEQYSYGKDPKTGVTGLKFDTGYEGGGGHGKASLTDIVLVSTNHETHNEEVRDVFLTLGGYFQWDVTEVAVKAGLEVSYSTISAPSAPAEQGGDDGGTCESNDQS